MNVSIKSFSAGKFLILKCSYSLEMPGIFTRVFLKNLTPSTRGNGYRKAEKCGAPAIQEPKKPIKGGLLFCRWFHVFND